MSQDTENNMENLFSMLRTRCSHKSGKEKSKENSHSGTHAETHTPRKLPTVGSYKDMSCENSLLQQKLKIEGKTVLNIRYKDITYLSRLFPWFHPMSLIVYT